MADFKRKTKEKCAAFAESDGDEDTDDEEGLFRFGGDSMEAEMAEQKRRQSLLLDYANNNNGRVDRDSPGEEDESEEEGAGDIWLRKKVKGKEKVNKNYLQTPPSSPTSSLGFSDSGINPSIFDLSESTASTSYFGNEGGDDLALLLCSLSEGPELNDDALLSSFQASGLQWKREGYMSLSATLSLVNDLILS